MDVRCHPERRAVMRASRAYLPVFVRCPWGNIQAHVPARGKVVVTLRPRKPLKAKLCLIVGVIHCGIAMDQGCDWRSNSCRSVSYTHLRAHETVLDLVCRLLLE